MKFTLLLCFVGLIAAVAADCTYNGKTYKTGESWSVEGSCIEQTCTGDNSLTAKACPEEQVINPAEYNLIPEDTTKPFPQCCPRYEKKA